MKLGVPYRVTSKVVEFDADRAHRVVLTSAATAGVGRSSRPVGGARVTLTYDQSTAKFPPALRLIGLSRTAPGERREERGQRRRALRVRLTSCRASPASGVQRVQRARGVGDTRRGASSGSSTSTSAPSHSRSTYASSKLSNAKTQRVRSVAGRLVLAQRRGRARARHALQTMRILPARRAATTSTAGAFASNSATASPQ